MVEQRTNLNFEEFLGKCSSHLESINDKKILDGIGELLDEKQRSWAKVHLKEETIFLLKALKELNGHPTITALPEMKATILS